MKKSTLLDGVVTEIAGKETANLAKALKKHKNVSEFRLASFIKKDINFTRNLLYKLYEHNLVFFTRKKDKKKGWYIYYWTLNEKQLPFIIADLEQKKLSRLKERLHREKAVQFFHCPSKCVRLDFDQATEFSFRCPECNELLNIEDNLGIIKQLEREISVIENLKKDAVVVKHKNKKRSAKKVVKKKGKKR